MASQRVTVAKIAGAAGAEVMSQLQLWAAERKLTDGAEEGDGTPKSGPGRASVWFSESESGDVTSHEEYCDAKQWSLETRNAIDAFVEALRENGRELPVVYMSDHVDMWSHAGVFEDWLSPEGCIPPVYLMSDRFELWGYSLPDDHVLANSLKHSLRLKRIRERNPQEDRWLVVNLLEAALAWEPIVDAAAVLIIRETLGGLATDEELEESLSEVPNWLAKHLSTTH